MEPIIQLHEKVNFTAIEIASINENDQMIVLGDDHGTVYTVRILHWKHFLRRISIV